MTFMKKWLKNTHAISFISDLQGTERYKFFLLMIAFSASIAVYSIVRSLKTSIFLSMVGVEYQPWTKMFVLLLIAPIMYIYSKVVDRYTVAGVAYFWFLTYAVLCLLLGLFLLHPVYGLANTHTGPDRYVGWLSYFVFELYASLVLSTIWAFMNSVSTPDSATKEYGIINAGGRVAGFVVAGLGGFLFAYSSVSELVMIPGMLFLAAILLCVMTGAIYIAVKHIPSNHMQGYGQAHAKQLHVRPKVGFFAGLKTLLVEPYVFGIFWMVFAIEMINGIFDYQMNVMVAEYFKNNARGMSIFMFSYTAAFQICALLLSLGGIRQLLKKLGVRRCLMITPGIVAVLALIIPFNKSIVVIFAILVALRALIYGFNGPVQEMLYIPTVKSIQFKSKSWIMSFGRSFSKVSSATVNLISQSGASVMYVGGGISFIIACSWILVAAILGKVYQKTIDNNELIGGK